MGERSNSSERKESQRTVNVTDRADGRRADGRSSRVALGEPSPSVVARAAMMVRQSLDVDPALTNEGRDRHVNTCTPVNRSITFGAYKDEEDTLQRNGRSRSQGIVSRNSATSLAAAYDAGLRPATTPRTSISAPLTASSAGAGAARRSLSLNPSQSPELNKARPLLLPPRDFYAPQAAPEDTGIPDMLEQEELTEAEMAALRAMLEATAEAPRRAEGPRRLALRPRTVPKTNALFPMYPGKRCIVAGRGTRVELHAHLEGSIRHETIWEYMRMKKMTMPGDGTLRAVRESLVANEPMNFLQFVEPIPIYLEAFAGDVQALERVAYEFCEDKVKQGVLYVEARYPPHLLTLSRLRLPRTTQELGDVVAAVNRGFRRAEARLGIVVRTVLAIVAGTPGADDVVNLCDTFQREGVVGIDLHLPYESIKKGKSVQGIDEVPLTRDELKAFNKAAINNINRTVHSGHLGSAYMVQRAVEKYRAQRVGHGYEVVKLPAMYAKCLERNLHFECCPWVSLLTRSVDAAAAAVSKHPIAKFAEDGANFSLNSGYPTLTGLSLQEEYDLASSWGLTEAHLVRSNINALRSSFLAAADKATLMEMLLENIGIRRRRRGSMTPTLS